MDVVEALAEAWASIDGKLEDFRACKADPAREDHEGYFEGYKSDAAELIDRVKARGFELRPVT